MKILNIHNIQRNTLLFCRDDRGNRELIKDESFFPFFYEYDKNGKDRGYDGTPLRKVVVGQPNQIKELRSFGSFASDIPYKKLYITHKIKEFEKVKYRYCFIDIEVLAKKGCFPDPKKAKEPVTCITVYDSFTDSFKTFWILDYAKEGRLDLERAEKSLLEDFSSYLKKLDVDIILGWNVEFDYVFLHNRIKQFAKKISSVSLDRYGSYDMNFSEEKCSFPVGISILDYMSLFKKVFMRESSYALNSVCQKHLGEADWGETIFDINPKVKDKNLNDVKRLVKIEKKYNLLNYFDEIRRLSKVEWEDLYHNSSIIMSLIYEEARDKNIVLPNKQENIEDESFEGATRESSKTGALFNIGKYDLESAYPTMIINFCLDFQNIVSTPEANTVNVNGIYFKQNPDALVPSMVKKILTLKNNLKKAVKENPSAELKIKYNAIKAVANSAFGAFGNKYFRLYDNRITSSITYLVRDVLMYSKAELEKKGIETVYWDTDSVFLNSNEPLLDFLNETIQKWGKEKYGKDFISLKFDYEGYFEKLFLLAKCRYIGYLNKKGKIEQEIKGVEVKRVSSSKFEAQFQEQLINKILDGADKPTVEAFIKEKKKELREVPLEEVAFPCKQNGNIYKNNPIQKRCVDNTKLIFGEFDVDLGVVFYYTYVKGFGFDKNSKEINVLAFRRGEAFKIPKEKIDYEELERRNIDSKVDNIFEAMKWIKNKNENQMRLF